MARDKSAETTGGICEPRGRGKEHRLAISEGIDSYVRAKAVRERQSECAHMANIASAAAPLRLRLLLQRESFEQPDKHTDGGLHELRLLHSTAPQIYWNIEYSKQTPIRRMARFDARRRVGVCVCDVRVQVYVYVYARCWRPFCVARRDSR